ncbi:protein eiger isoform X2 [Diachasmimorpha longicaudata]|uniref:protein eiger isoform X2 n=1 Tax=Diachasmimorpha longicaudata TaxID=58733 RepID=UPI0030B8C038
MMEKISSVIPVDRKARVKGQRNEKISASDDSTRAFLNFSRENLSVLQSDIERGFPRKTPGCLKINRQTMLSLLAICLAIVCLTVEAVKIKKIVNNTRNIDGIKVELETLKKKILELNLLEEFKAFEQQLYADEDDFNDTDIDEYDYNYDNNYDANQNNYPTDDETPSSIRSDQTTLTSRSQPIAEKDGKIPPSPHEIYETGNENSANSKHTKTKRFISKESQTLNINGEHPGVQSELLRSRENDTNGNLMGLNSRDTIFSKKYYGSRRRRPHRKASDMKKAMKIRGMSRRHIRPSRQIFAAHYGADSTMFHRDDEHTGNGRARHNEGVFKAWRGSNWMDDLGMNRYFSLARDGKLTVHEAGLYLVYAQIHYLDEHDENGFHLLVNGQPILQCMVYSPGNGHKSRSCFSAQVTYLLSGDRVVLKEVGPARYTLFQADKSFFGLAKLGDNRQSQQNQMRHNNSAQLQTTPFQ